MTHEIWIDVEAMKGVPDGFSNVLSERLDEILGPMNVKSCPCDTCPLAATCMVNETECSAFRNWCSTGDYWDTDGWDMKTVVDKKTKKKSSVKVWRVSDVGRLVRTMS